MSIYPYISNKKCKNCTGDISIKRSRDKNNEFCGTACVGRYRLKKKEITNCNFCNLEFTKSNKTKNLFCSKNCANKSRRVDHKRVCKRCGVEFTTHNMANINRGKNIYCSMSCSSRKYEVNEKYFENIDNQNKAYILGFIYADGCISKTKYELIIKLHNKDNGTLEKIKTELVSNHPIKLLTNYKNHQCRLGISSKKLCSDLIKIGLTPSKTFTIIFPKLEGDLIRHFIRGYFDGDGCLSNGGRNKNLNYFNIFTASEEFKIRIVEILSENNIKTNTYERNNGYSINITSKENSKLFYDYLYGDAVLFMERKKNKWVKSRLDIN